MANGATTQEVLQQAGRAGWRVVSIQPEMIKNPVSDVEWNKTHQIGEAYPTDVPTGKFVIQVMPPTGAAGAAQNIVVGSATPANGQKYTADDVNGFFDFARSHGADPTTVNVPLWDKNTVTAPDKAPATPAAGKDEPSSIESIGGRKVQVYTNRPADGSQGPKMVDLGPAEAPTRQDPSQQALSQAQADAINAKLQPELDNLVATNALSKAQADAIRAKLNGDVASTAANTELTATQAAAVNAKLGPEIANLLSSGQLTQAQVDVLKAKLPGELAGQEATTVNTQATTANTQATTAATQAATQRANAPVTSAGTPTSGPYIAVTDPTTGKVTYQANPNAPIADVGAAVKQLQSVAQAKRDDLQQQVQAGKIDQATALQQFNDFWNTQVAPQQQAIAEAQHKQQLEDQAARNQQDQVTNQAASTQLSHAGQTAQLGSNLLQKRADLAQQKAQGVLDIGTGSKNFGIAGGVPNLSGLYTAATQSATDQLGGQSTLDAATRMVQSIDPGNQTGFAAHAAAALDQVLTQAQKQSPLGNTPYTPGGPQQQPPVDVAAALDRSRYSGSFSPQTVISPDGTVTITHTPGATPPTQPIAPYTYQPETSDQSAARNALALAGG